MIGSLHPALLPLLGALVVPFLRGKPRMAFMLLVPVVGLINLLLLPVDFRVQSELLGFTLVLGEMTDLSFIFGLLFHIAQFVATVYALKVEDRFQTVAALAYPGSALLAVFAGDWLTLFVGWEILAVSSAFFIWARRTEGSLAAGNRYFVQQVISGLLILAGVAVRTHAGAGLEFEAVFGVLTEELMQGGLGATLILLGVGIKCAFPFLHTWLVDGYPEGTESGTVFLSGFTTKVAICTLARGFAGAEILIYVGAAMAVFPIFYAVIANDLRRVLGYSMINQIGFMVVGIGIGNALGINGAIAHAFNDVFFKGLLFMTMGAVLFRTGKMGGSELGGLYKTMPQTAGFCLIGAASISAFPLFSGFVSKSMIMLATAEGHHTLVYFLLLFAAAGVFHHAGIKIPFFAFFGHDSGQRPKEAPWNMRIAMGMAAAMCIGIGCFPMVLYSMLPLPVDFHPYHAAHIVEQLQILFFSALAFTTLMLTKVYPPEIPSVNLDADWFYRKGWGRVHAFVVGPFDRLASVVGRWVLDEFPALLSRSTPIQDARRRLSIDWILSAPVLIVMIALLGFLVLNFVKGG